MAAISFHQNMARQEVFGVIPYFGIIFPNIMLHRLFQESNAHESKCKQLLLMCLCNYVRMVQIFKCE